MKRILLFLSVVILLSGCSLYQEVEFKENGQVSYLMSIDAGQLLSMGLPTGDDDKIPTDTTISVMDMLKEKKNMENISETEKKLYKDIAPMMVKIKSDVDKKELFISYYGDFENITALNNALSAISILDSIDNSKKDGNIDKKEEELNKIMQHYNLYTWDGKKMTAVSQYKPKEKEISDNVDEDELSGLNSLSTMFAGGKMKTKYIFPGKVIKTSNPDALFSIDGKSVIIESSATDFFDNPEQADIVIELE